MTTNKKIIAIQNNNYPIASTIVVANNNHKLPNNHKSLNIDKNNISDIDVYPINFERKDSDLFNKECLIFVVTSILFTFLLLSSDFDGIM